MGTSCSEHCDRNHARVQWLERVGRCREERYFPLDARVWITSDARKACAICDSNASIDCMASILVRNVPESTKRKLKIRAATRGRSMEEEVREILNNAVHAAPRKNTNLGEVIHRRFARLGGVDLEPLPREPMRDPDWLKDWKE